MMSKMLFLRRTPMLAGAIMTLTMLCLTGGLLPAAGQDQPLAMARGQAPEFEPEAAEKKSGISMSLTRFPGAGFSMKDLQGNSVQFEELKGKVIFLNLWATWCRPCITEMPGIQSLYEKLDPEKFAFVMLSVDQEGRGKVAEFVKKKGFSFPVYMPEGSLPEVFNTKSIPSTFIISPEGKIVHRQNGMAEYDNPKMRYFLTELAKN